MKIHISLALAFVLTNACLHNRAHADAPLVTSFTITPEPVNITTGTQVINVSLYITDETGFSYGTLDFYNPSLTLVTSKFFAGSSRVSGDSTDGEYHFTVSIPAYAQPGNWNLYLMVRNSAAEVRFYGPGQTNYPGPSGPTLAVVNTGPVDTAAPTLVSRTVSPGTFDSTSGDTTVTLDLRITDALAGFDHGVVTFYDPNGDTAVFLNPYFSFRTTGDEFDGTYVVSTSVPQGSIPGDWTCEIQLFDKLGNMDWFSGNAFTISSGGTPTDYASFVSFHGLIGNDALVDADPDHDKLPCGLEFLMGTNPKVATDATGKYWQSRDDTHLHLNLLIDAALTVSPNGGFLEAGGGANPFRLTGQTQPGLGPSWSNSLPQQVSGHHYRVSLPLGGGTGFIRLYLEQP